MGGSSPLRKAMPARPRPAHKILQTEVGRVCPCGAKRNMEGAASTSGRGFPTLRSMGPRTPAQPKGQLTRALARMIEHLRPWGHCITWE